MTPSLAPAYIILFALQTIVVTRMLQWGIKPGTHSLYSPFYVRKWLADQMMSLSLIVLHPIYATVYVSLLFPRTGRQDWTQYRDFYRLFSDASTARDRQRLLHCRCGDAWRSGRARTAADPGETVIGNVSFVGNSALIPQGYTLPDHMLVGVLSTPPTPEQLATEEARDYFGSPAIPLPRRQESQVFSDRLTTFPKPAKRIARSIVELIRIIIPETVIICMSVIFIAYGHDLVTKYVWWKSIIGIPVLYLLCIGLPAFFFTVLLKWLTVGRYEEDNHPMWSWHVWRSEAITTTYEALAVPFFLEYLKGTAWLPILLRLFGEKQVAESG